MEEKVLSGRKFGMAVLVGYILLTLAAVAGVIVGAALVYIGNKFHVEVDEREVRIREVLPGNNCGACGYAGCHQMAENLVSGKEPMVSKCKPGKKDKNYDPIIAYLSTHPDPDGTVHVPLFIQVVHIAVLAAFRHPRAAVPGIPDIMHMDNPNRKQDPKQIKSPCVYMRSIRIFR